MTHRILTLILVCMATLASWSVSAQGLRASPPSSSGAALTKPPANGLQQADYIVAVVNSEPITNSEVRREVLRVRQQMTQQRVAQPDNQVLTRQVLERLINQHLQLQRAKEIGLKVETAAIDQAEANVARQNQMSISELHRRLVQEGLDVKQFRQQLSDQIMLTKVREREIEPRVRVSELDIDDYLREQSRNDNPAEQLVQLAQILVAVPEGANAQQVATLQAKAKRVLERLRAGEDFAKLVLEVSESSDRTSGGLLGLRTADRYPPVFIEATQSLPVGGVSELVRTGAGFHILKVVEKRRAGMPDMTVTLSHARHILLVPSAQLSQAAALARLADYKKRIEAGQADFAELARQHSQDGSAREGGDLGWAYPGQFVPEFEAVMNALAPGQIGEPLVSRFGVHLIQMLGRREEQLNPAQQREVIRGTLREKKLDETYENWAKDLRARAYVEMREPPQPQ